MRITQFCAFYNTLKSMAPSFYAVAKGRKPGVYNTWDECKVQVHEFSGSIYKKFGSIHEANNFIKQKTGTILQSVGITVENKNVQSNSKNVESKSKNVQSKSEDVQKKRKSVQSKSENVQSKSENVQTKSENVQTKCENVQSKSNTVTPRIGKRPRKQAHKVATKKIKILEMDYEKVSVKKPKLKNSTSDLNSVSSEQNKSSNDLITDDDGYVNVYTDGACSLNGKKNARAGIGVWFGDNHPENVSQPVVGRATNNMAEIQAVTVAVKQAKMMGIKKLKINTDSKFLISCITMWMPKWKKNGWKTVDGKPVINKTELIEMEEALTAIEVKWNHVNGHVGIYGNEMADKLARAGCLSY